MVVEVAARAPRRAVGCRQHGAVPRLRRGVVLHGSGDERDRRHGDALTTGFTPAEISTAEPRAATAAPMGDVGTAPALCFDGVSMIFPDGTHALRETSFDVRQGEFAAVVGPSGCGKSTLLRIASGLNPATSGSVTVDRSSLRYVFQDATLLQWRNVLRNVELLAELEGVPKAERRRRAT